MSDDKSAPGIHSNAGYWDSEVLELAKRLFYRPEFHPLLLEYLGASVVSVDGDEKKLTLAEQILEQEGLSDRI